MSEKILVVEDEFIEANNLRIILEKAGHLTTGIAKSYDHAMVLMERERPDIVVLDVFLKGKRTGLDLATHLSKENIPFIYLSANSNPSILNAAKLTKPYGFLVKPFRPNDVLAALDIATYRHQHQDELRKKQEQLLSTILASILEDDGDSANKLVRMAQAFKPFVPFDYMFIDANIENPNLDLLFSLKRVGFDEYETTSGSQLKVEMKLDQQDYIAWRKRNIDIKQIIMENEEQFEASTRIDPFLHRLKKHSGVKSRIVVPLTSVSGTHMNVRFYDKEPQIYGTEHLQLLNPILSLIAMVIESLGLQKLSSHTESHHPKVETAEKSKEMDGIIGKSHKLLHALDQATQVANFDTSVLILGETGVGKEGLVQAIHQLSGRNKKPLIKINCAAIPAQLIESELFGHEKGSFTGAFERHIGKFEQAQGGTIFLDEIGELPLNIQTKLLRVLQEKEIERIGGRTTIKIDARVIAATNRNLHKEVIDGTFRMDLFYRINVFPIILPPLRERKEDIPLLVNYFLHKHAYSTGGEVKQIANDVMDQLFEYSWPGNIRELQHLIERSVVMTNTSIISRINMPIDVPLTDSAEPILLENFQTIEEVDRAHIIAALRKCNGKVAGKGGAAEILNIPATTLNSKMKKLKISWKFTY